MDNIALYLGLHSMLQKALLLKTPYIFYLRKSTRISKQNDIKCIGTTTQTGSPLEGQYGTVCSCDDDDDDDDIHSPGSLLGTSIQLHVNTTLIIKLHGRNSNYVPTRLSVGFTENRLKKRKYLESGSSLSKLCQRRTQISCCYKPKYAEKHL